MGLVGVGRSYAQRCFVGVLFAALFLLWIPSAKAQTEDVSGSYQCTQAKVQGKVITCNAAPLILKNDGRFELRGWEGTYMVDGEWVQLSDSLTKARAKIAPGHKIVLKYYGKHGWAEMTYERRLAELGKTSLS
jgi:ligand-binding sensor domain-containing protein